jgi:hypothetical protein
MYFMANERITDLPTVTSASLSDIIYAVQGYSSPTSLGTSVQETLQQVFNLMLSETILSFAGNPNGNVAGTTFTLCWDTTDNILYICTTSGTSTTAVWTMVAEPAGGALTNGQIMIGSTGFDPVANTITPGSNISIANGAGTITISATGLAGIGWVNVTGATQAMSVDTGYVADRSSLVTLTLPATAAFGTIIYVQGLAAGGWTIAQNSGQQIFIGSAGTTVGASGSVSSTNAHDSVALLCVTANTTFSALGAPQGNLTIV